MRFKLIFTLPFLALATSGIAQSDDALVAACRATEVTFPQSCGCTVAAGRDAGLSDAQLASLFKDDGHTQPVPQDKYAAFWGAKTQCLMNDQFAQLGISQSNPLPGVPDHMRPGAPLPANAPAIARPASPAIAASSQSPSLQSGITQGDDRITRVTDKLVFSYDYDDEIAALPGFASYLEADLEKTYTQALRQADEQIEPAGNISQGEYGVTWTMNSRLGRLVSLTRDHGEFMGGAGGIEAQAMFWDTRLQREYAPQDLFAQGAFEAQMRSRYCNALELERDQRLRGGNGPDALYFNVSCPDFDRLAISYKNEGWTFFAAPYVAGSRAEGPYEVTVPMPEALRASAKPAYRADFGAESVEAPQELALGTIPEDLSVLEPGSDCVTYVYRYDVRPTGDLFQTSDWIELAEQQSRLLFVNGGPLESNDWRAGVMLEGEFRRVEQTSSNRLLGQEIYRSGNLTVTLDLDTQISEVSAGSWGIGTLIVQQGRSEARIPVLYEKWQCT